MNLSTPPIIHVISVTYQRYGELKIFIQSWLNQSQDNWLLTVIHDGPDDEFNRIMSVFSQEAPNKIFHYATKSRHNDYGHSLRNLGLQNTLGDYVLLTNSDNYFIPHAIKFINEVFIYQNPDVILFDMVHSHDRGLNKHAYTILNTKYERYNIDISSALIKADLAKKAGFKDNSHDGDQTYFEDIARVKHPELLSIMKISRVLFVHN